FTHRADEITQHRAAPTTPHTKVQPVPTRKLRGPPSFSTPRHLAREVYSPTAAAAANPGTTTANIASVGQKPPDARGRTREAGTRRPRIPADFSGLPALGAPTTSLTGVVCSSEACVSIRASKSRSPTRAARSLGYCVYA